MTSNTFQSDLLKLIFQNLAIANLGDASGVQPSATAGSLAVALHSADPGAAGDQTTNEIAYTSYSRVLVARDNTHFTVSGSSPTTVTNASTLLFPTCTGGSATAAWFSIGYLASGAGTIIARGPLVSTWYDFTGKASSDVATAPGHALSVNDPVVVVAVQNGTVPAGITAGTIYYVKTVSGNDITLSATVGGATLDITADGAAAIGKITTLAISNTITPQFSASNLAATFM